MSTKIASDIYRWIFQIPLDDVKATDKDTTTSKCCVLCGKKINGEEKHFVHQLTNGNLVSTPEAFDDSEDQGFFAIGNECKKRLPNNFVFSSEQF